MISEKNKDVIAACLHVSTYIENKENMDFYIMGVEDYLFFNNEVSSEEYKSIKEFIDKFLEGVNHDS